MKIVGKILKALLCIVGVLVLLLVLAVGVFTVAEYRPADTESVIAQQETEAVLETGKPLTIVSWNCGYGALGDNADFFMDGGSSVYTADRARVESNLAGIRDALTSMLSNIGASLPSCGKPFPAPVNPLLTTSIRFLCLTRSLRWAMWKAACIP